MAIELGKAYVQILPSARGISGSIQKVIAPEALAAGRTAGRNIANAIADSLGKAGSTMTKYITTPVMTAASAVAGLVGTLGFKRLVAMDEAQARLKGLGYEGKQLEIIMNNARNAVQGTTLTVADGAYIAAGALAAGVKEGKELERYIRLVGDAAIGSGAPVEEMAMIFNRVASEGYLTRNELEMINYRLPGFANAMMEYVGASSREAFYEMLRAGKVSTADMLNVMEDFAGGMAAAYAETWSGLKDNIIANIGIIGEALLEGIFEDGKKGMAEFLDYLRESEELKEWARETGEVLRQVFSTIVEVIKILFNWWTSLDSRTKEAIITLLSIVVIAGPVLLFFSKMISTVIKVIETFSKLKWLWGLLKMAASALGGAIASISAPVWAVIAAIAALIAIGVALWKNWDTIKEHASNLWEHLVTGFTFVKDKIVEFFGQTIPEQFNKFVQFIAELPGKVMVFLKKLFLEDIPYAVGYGIGFLVDKVRTGITNTINFFSNLPGRIKEFLGNAINNISAFAINAKNKAIEAGRNILNNVVNFVKNLPGRIKVFLSNTISNIGSFAINAKNKALEAGRNIFNGVVDAVKKIPGQMLSIGKDIINGLINGIKNNIGSVASMAKEIASSFVGGFKKAMGIKSPSRVAADLMGDVLAGFGVGFAKNENGILEQAKDFIRSLIDIFSEDFIFDFEANFNGIVGQDEIVASSVGLPALAANAGYSGESTNVQIVIENMNVRDDQDIHRISRELQRLIDRNKRGRGF